MTVSVVRDIIRDFGLIVAKVIDGLNKSVTLISIVLVVNVRKNKMPATTVAFTWISSEDFNFNFHLPKGKKIGLIITTITVITIIEIKKYPIVQRIKCKRKGITYKRTSNIGTNIMK